MTFFILGKWNICRRAECRMIQTDLFFNIHILPFCLFMPTMSNVELGEFSSVHSSEGCEFKQKKQQKNFQHIAYSKSAHWRHLKINIIFPLNSFVFHSSALNMKFFLSLVSPFFYFYMIFYCLTSLKSWLGFSVEWASTVRTESFPFFDLFGA